MNALLIALISLVSFLIVSFIVFLILIKPSGRREKMEKYKSLNFAHRGLHDATRAENSTSAFAAAVEAGFAIELDVRLSSDGVLMVFHDDTLERMTGERGRVDSKTAEELRSIKLGETEDTIPTFDEVLALVDGRVPLLVEIKEDAGQYGVTEKTVETLKGYKGEFLIESFNPLALARVKKLMPEAPRGILSKTFLKEKEYRAFTYFLLQCLVLNAASRPDFIAFDHRHSKNLALRRARGIFKAPTLAWTVRSEGEEKMARKHGFDGMIFEGYIPTKR